MQVAPTLKQYEQLGFWLSHLVLRALQTWHAVMASEGRMRFLGQRAASQGDYKTSHRSQQSGTPPYHRRWTRKSDDP